MTIPGGMQYNSIGVIRPRTRRQKEEIGSMGRRALLRIAALLIALACPFAARGRGFAMAETAAEGEAQVVVEEVARVYRGPSGVTMLPSRTPAPGGDAAEEISEEASEEADAPEASEPDLSDDVAVTLAVSPAQLATPGEVNVTFTLENRSEYDARNVLISTDELPGARFTESVGSIAAGESQTVSRAYAVTQAELDEGRIEFFISY